MPIFRTTEKQRYARIKARLFSGAACRPGNYRGMPRSFCLADACAAENLHASLRTAAVRYFRDRAIHWHDGRGANATSADFALRFRRYDGRIELVLGEWKYTEFYSTRLRPAEALNPTQLRVYRAAFAAWQARQPDLPAYESFFAEPFYQLMRLMLLAQAMEAARTGDGGELSADIVRVVHIAPAANRNFALSLTSPALARYGKTVSSIWSRIAPAERFLSIATESLLTVIEQVAPEPLHPWRDYLLQRYGWWR